MSASLLITTGDSVGAISINPPTKYRCFKGHEWESNPWEMETGYTLNVPKAGYVRLCPFCVVEFAKAHLGTVEEVK